MQALLNLFVILSLTNLTTRAAVMQKVKSHHLGKRSYVPWLQKLKDDVCLPDQSDREMMWKENVQGTSTLSPMVTEDYWSTRNYDLVRTPVLSHLLREDVKSRQDQAFVVLNLSKKIIEERSRTTHPVDQHIHNPLSWKSGVEDLSPPSDFLILNHAIKKLLDESDQFEEEADLLVHWSMVLSRLLVATMRNSLFLSSELDGWRDILFSQFIYIAFKPHAVYYGENVIGSKILETLEQAEKWWTEGSNLKISPLIHGHQGDITELAEWWSIMKNHASKIEQINRT